MSDGFARIPDAMISDPALRDCDVRVYAALLTFADYATGDNCYPSIEAVGERSARKRAAAADAIARLVAAGWVTRHPRKTIAGDSDTTMYRFPRQSFGGRPVSQTTPSGRMDDVVRQDGRRSSDLADGGRPASQTGVVCQDGHNLEPSTKNHLPRETPALPVQPSFDLQAPAPKAPKEPTAKQQQFLEDLELTNEAIELWNRIMRKQPRAAMPTAKGPRIAFVKVIGSAIAKLDSPEETERFLTWASRDPWRNGDKRTLAIERWMAGAHFAETLQAFDNYRKRNGAYT